MNDINTIKLAHLIVTHLNPETGHITEELKQLLNDKNINEIAYWLQFYSFLRYQLYNALTQLDNNSPETVKECINSIFTDFFNREKLKSISDKFYAQTFTNANLQTSIIEGEEFQSNLNKQANPLAVQTVQRLTQVKRSRPQHQNFQAIFIANARSNPKTSLDELMDEINNLKPGERRQVIYYHNPDLQNHAVAFDIERTETNKINIFCADAASDTNQLEILEKLYPRLSSLDSRPLSKLAASSQVPGRASAQNRSVHEVHEDSSTAATRQLAEAVEFRKRSSEFEIKAGRLSIQKDTENCGLFAESILQELAKYPHVFDYIDARVPEDTNTKMLPSYELSVQGEFQLKKETHFSKHLKDITWIYPASLPVKIIAMSQSYESMKHHLDNSFAFDLDSNEFIEKHKAKYGYREDSKKTTTYTHRRRDKIAKQFGAAWEAIKQKLEAEAKSNNLLLANVLDGNIPTTLEEIKKFNPSNEQLQETFNSFLKSKTSNYIYNIGDDKNKFSAIEKKFLVLLRHVYVENLVQDYLKNRTPEALEKLRNHLFRDHIIRVNNIADEEQQKGYELNTITDEALSFEEILYLNYYPFHNTYLKSIEVSIPLLVDYYKQVNSLTEGEINLFFSSFDNLVDATGQPFLSLKKKLDQLSETFKFIIKNKEDNLSEQDILSLTSLRKQYINILITIKDTEDKANLHDLPQYTGIQRITTFLNDTDEINSYQLPTHLNLYDFLNPVEACDLYQAAGDRGIEPIFHFPFENPLLKLNKTTFTSKTLIENLQTYVRTHLTSKGESIISAGMQFDMLKGFYNTLSNKERNQSKKEVMEAVQEIINKSEFNDYENTAFLNELFVPRFSETLNANKLTATKENLQEILDRTDNIYLKIDILCAAYEKGKQDESFLPSSFSSFFSRNNWTTKEKMQLIEELLIDVLKREPYRAYTSENTMKRLKSTSLYKNSSKQQEIDSLARGVGREKFDRYKPVPIYKTFEEAPTSNDDNPQLARAKWIGLETKNYYQQHHDRVSSTTYYPHYIFQDTSISIGMASYNKEGQASNTTSFLTYSDKDNSDDPSLLKQKNWKFNLSIPQENMPEAIEIVTTWLNYYGVKNFKIANQAVMEQQQADKHWRGRAMVIYTHSNPEMSVEQWIEIINKIEDELSKANISPLENVDLQSNRKLGRFTSYLNENWEVTCTFEEGLKNAGLDDLFADYSYDEANGCIQKTPSIIVSL